MATIIWSCANILAASGAVCAPIALVEEIAAHCAKRNLIAHGSAVTEDGTHQWLYVER